MKKIIVTTPEELALILNNSMGPKLDELRSLIDKKINPPKSKSTIKEVAKKLNVTELTIRNYINKGFIKAEKIGRRIVIDNQELEKALTEVKSLKYKRQ